MKRDIIEQNRLANQYRKEANKHQICSPGRINEYIGYRLKGYSDEKALEKTKNKR